MKNRVEYKKVLLGSLILSLVIIILFVFLLFTIGAPVMVFEYWLSFLESFDYLGRCSRFFSLLISVLMLIPFEICYQITLLYLLGLLIVPLIFYYPLWDSYMEFFVSKIYSEAPGI